MVIGAEGSVEGVTTESATAEGEELDFSSLKKKKKKILVAEETKAEFEAKLEEAGIADEKVDDEDPFAVDKPSEEGNEEEAWLKSDRDYTYEEVKSHDRHFN